MGEFCLSLRFNGRRRGVEITWSWMARAKGPVNRRHRDRARSHPIGDRPRRRSLSQTGFSNRTANRDVEPIDQERLYTRFRICGGADPIRGRALLEELVTALGPVPVLVARNRGLLTSRAESSVRPGPTLPRNGNEKTCPASRSSESGALRVALRQSKRESLMVPW